MKKLVLAFAILALLGLGFAVFSVSGSANKEVYKPGESGAITLAISNSAAGGKITGAQVDITGSPSFIYTGTIFVGEMNAGTSTVLTVPITVKPDASSGVYIFTIKVSGSEIASEGTQSFSVKQASVPIYVLKKPIITIDGYSADYSENGNFSFRINNQGGMARNMRLSVLPPFGIEGANELFLGDVGGTKSIAIRLDIGAASEGSNTLKMLLAYDDELGNEQTELKDISLTVRKETPDIAVVQVSKIAANADNAATFKIVNGGKALQDVKLSFANENIIAKEGNEIKVGDLASGESKEVTFTMHPNISPGTSSEQVTIKYNDGGKEKIKTVAVALTVDSDSDVQVYLEAKPIPLAPGQEETLSVTVANIWDYPIESTSVRIAGQFYDLVSVQNEQYIGLLSKGDFSSVQFKVRVRDDAPLASNLTVFVRYKDAFGNFVERKKQIPVAISPRAAERWNPLPLLAGAFLALIAAYWAFFRKKKAAA